MTDVEKATYFTGCQPGTEEHDLYLVGLQEIACFEGGPPSVVISDEREALLWLQGRN